MSRYFFAISLASCLVFSTTAFAQSSCVTEFHTTLEERKAERTAAREAFREGLTSQRECMQAATESASDLSGKERAMAMKEARVTCREEFKTTRETRKTTQADIRSAHKEALKAMLDCMGVDGEQAEEVIDEVVDGDEEETEEEDMEGEAEEEAEEEDMEEEAEEDAEEE